MQLSQQPLNDKRCQKFYTYIKSSGNLTKQSLQIYDCLADSTLMGSTPKIYILATNHETLNDKRCQILYFRQIKLASIFNTKPKEPTKEMRTREKAYPKTNASAAHGCAHT